MKEARNEEFKAVRVVESVGDCSTVYNRPRIFRFSNLHLKFH